MQVLLLVAMATNIKSRRNHRWTDMRDNMVKKVQVKVRMLTMVTIALQNNAGAGSVGHGRQHRKQ